MSKWKSWTSLELKRLVELRRSGAKVVAIAARLGRGVGSVKTQLHRLGIVVEPWRLELQHRGYGVLLRQVTRALLAGGHVVETAERFGVHYGYVSTVRKRLGLPAATPQERLSRSWAFRKACGQKPPNRWAGRGQA